MVLTIKNFESQQVGPGVTETAPTNLSATAGVRRANVTWTSATGESGAVWSEERLVRKEGSAPMGSFDGVVVATITTKDQYSTNSFEDLLLDENKTYYYKAFAMYDNGTEKGSTAITVTSNAPITERIEYKIKADSNGIVYAPTSGKTTSNTSTAPYRWMYSVDGVLINKAEGTGGTNIELKTGLTAGSEHTVIIAPIEETYQWARAYGWYNSGIADLLTQIIYDGSYIGYAVSDTDTGNNFRYSQYHGCTSLTTAPTEAIPNSVTTIGDGFRQLQYYKCTSLTTAPAEVLPNSVTTIGNNFRASQYLGCTSLTTAPAEVLPNSVTTIGDGFRQQQYLGCTSLTTAPAEVLPNSVTTIGNIFRAFQYYGCTSLTTAPAEVLPNSVTTIGNNFRAFQYQGCTSLTTVTGIQATPTTVTKGGGLRQQQFANAGNTTNKMTVTINGTNIETGETNSLGLVNTNVSQIKVVSSLVTAYKNSADWSNITDSKFVAL